MLYCFANFEVILFGSKKQGKKKQIFPSGGRGAGHIFIFLRFFSSKKGCKLLYLVATMKKCPSFREVMGDGNLNF